ERREKRRLAYEKLTNIKPHDESQIEAEMPPEDPIILSRELLNRCRTNGVFTTSTVEALGLSGRLEKGWVGRLCGTTVSRDKFRAALCGRYIYSKRQFPIQQ